MISVSRNAARPATASGPRLGERLRQLRVAAGLTQSDLAGARFSKEYVSQIERGKTRPTRETVEWLALRLGVDHGFLANGVSNDERGRVEAALARAEALVYASEESRALEEFERAAGAVRAAGSPELEVRALSGEALARLLLGEVREASELLSRARALTEEPSFSDLERAEVLFRLGVCRYRLSSIATSVALLNEALGLAERSGLPCDRLRSEILHWRSRCYRRQRDLEAAREDVEQALELARGVGDQRSLANLYFQASLVAERQGHLVLARSFAERARAQYEELADRSNVGRLLNNLGGLTFLLGKPGEAVDLLKDAFRVALDVGDDAEAARVISSLAQVHLRTGKPALAEEQARQALELIGDRVDFLDEVGSARLVLGQALLEQGSLDEAEEALREADASFEQLGALSHRAAAWVAQGDLARRRGDDAGSAHLYRSAAEALQDVHF